MLSALVIAWLIRPAEPHTARTGGEAPEFTVELIDGGSFGLGEFLASDDRPLVLNLWASWCLPCREETPEISAFATDYPEVMVLGVAVQDSEAESRAFAADLAPSYPLAQGNMEFEAAYPVIGLPATYVIDAEGRVTEIFNGILDRETLERLVFG